MSPVDRAVAWLRDQIGRAITEALSGRFSLVGILVLVALAVLTVGLVVRLVRLARTDPHRDEVVFTDKRPPADWLAEAVACERRGDHAGAVLARYRALIAELARRGFVDEIPGRTAGDYRRTVDEVLPTGAPPFRGATDLFEATAYGAATAGPEESARLATLSGAVLSEAR